MCSPSLVRRAHLFMVVRHHWPEYLMEAWGIATILVSAGLFAALLEYPGSPLRTLVPEPPARKALLGLMVGLTNIGLVYSPWGQQSGAHFNPAVTLSFLRLGKVARTDATWYMLAQFAGGTLAVLLVAAALGGVFTAPPVHYIVTVPGHAGQSGAFATEFAIAFAVMIAVLRLMNSVRWSRFTGLAAGGLIALAIPLAAPISRMSINPARTFASAFPSGVWTAAWLYFVAPVLGMLSAVEAYRRLGGATGRMCAKLDHPPHKRCIHCGYQPPPQGAGASEVTP